MTVDPASNEREPVPSAHWQPITLWHWLVDPAPALPERERGRARLLSVLLGLASAWSLLSLALLFLNAGSSAEILAFSLTTIGLGAARVVSRGRWHLLAAWLTLGTVLLASLAARAIGSFNPLYLVFPLLGVLAGSLLLNIRSAAGVLAGGTGAMLLLWLVLPGVAGATLVYVLLAGAFAGATIAALLALRAHDLAQAEAQVGQLARELADKELRAEQLDALNTAAVKIQQLIDPHAIIQIACDELRRFGILLSVSLARREGLELEHIHTSMDETALDEYIATFGRKQVQFSMPIEGARQVWERLQAGETIVESEAVARIVASFPPEARSVGEWIQGHSAQGTVLLAPLTRAGVTVGVISVAGEHVGEAFVPAVTLFARHLSVALENARLFGLEQSRRGELAALYDLSRTLADAEDSARIAEVVVRRAVETVGVDFAALVLIEGNALVMRAGFPLPAVEHPSMGCREPLAAHPHCQRVMAQHQPVVDCAAGIEMDEAERAAGWHRHTQALCHVPLRVGDRALGLLLLGQAKREGADPYTPEKLRLAQSIGDQAASALHRATLREQTERRLRQVQALHAIDLAISSNMDLTATLRVLLEQVVEQLRIDAAAVLLFNAHTQTLEYAARRGWKGEAIELPLLRLGDEHAGEVALDLRLVSIPNLAEATAAGPLAAVFAGEGFCSYNGVPLVTKRQLKGVLEVYHRTPLERDPEWLAFLEALAQQAAIAIDSTSLFNDLQTSNVSLKLAYDATIGGWSRALDLRDKETEGHTLRVTEVTERLARAMGVPDADIVQIRWGALLHDIGKMGIPDSILFKPEPLSSQEQVIMQRHPLYAYELLAPIAYLRPALDIPYCHHERWDGTGYPRRLKGEQIPLSARIFAVVDTWDALRSDRPYRLAWPDDQVRAYIREQAGAQFDPRVVEVFLRVVG